MDTEAAIVLPGGAGLVGQNLVPRLKAAGYRRLVVLDKHRANLAVLKRLHPDVEAREADLAEPGAWEESFAGSQAAVMLQAQIGDLDPRVFRRNNLITTQRVLDAMRRHRVPYLVHVSSSVVESTAHDDYSETKRAQEVLALDSGIPAVVLRPTLMFGWFDRKHLGWLSRFMRRCPVFPIPGDGRFPRQPLYAGDFCAIIAACLERRAAGGTHNISGLETVDYVDIIRAIRTAVGSRAVLLPLPVPLFGALLRLWALADRHPPFTAAQLKALTAGDRFEVMDWPGLFGVAPTPFARAVEETFTDPRYSGVALEF